MNSKRWKSRIGLNPDRFYQDPMKNDTSRWRVENTGLRFHARFADFITAATASGNTSAKDTRHADQAPRINQAA